MFLVYLLASTVLVFWACNIVTSARRLSAGVKPISYFLLFFVSALNIILISFREIGYENGVIYGGFDSINYARLFYVANIDYVDSIIMQASEPGFATLVWFFSVYIGNYSIFQIPLYLFIFYSYYFFTKKLPRTPYALISFVLIAFFIVDSFNTLRQVLAVFVSFFAYNSLSKGGYRNAVIIAACAVAFHVSAIILFLIIFFHWVHDKTSERASVYLIYGAVLFGAVITAFFVVPYFISGTGYSEYEERGAGEFSLNTFIAAGVILYMALNRRKELVSYNEFNRTLMWVLPSIIFVLPIFYRYGMGYRFLLFYTPVMYILMPSLFQSYRLTSSKNLAYIPLYIAICLYVVARVYRFFSEEHEYAGAYRFGLTLIP
jgi:hypothetical protein